MSPTNPSLYSAYDTLADAIIGRYVSLQSSVGTYFKDLRSGEFSCGAPLATVRRSMLNAIHLIGFWCIPSQVINVIISRIAIVMATLRSLRRFTLKCAKHGSADAVDFLLVVLPQLNKWAPIIFINGRCFQFAGLNGNDATDIRNLIERLESRNRPPHFYYHFHIPITVDMGIVA